MRARAATATCLHGSRTVALSAFAGENEAYAVGPGGQGAANSPGGDHCRDGELASRT
jgi:hypothetical protein